MKQFSADQIATLHGNAAQMAERIAQKEITIAVVGLGYVGMPIALEFAKKQFRCVGIDVSQRKVDALNAGENFIEDLNDEEVATVVEQGLLSAHSDYSIIEEADVVFIAVPTPFNDYKDPDISYILAAGQAMAPYLKAGTLVILKSTTFPGTTEDFLIPALEQSGMKAGQDFYVAFSPERVDPGNKVWHTGNTPIVVGGTDHTSTILASYVNNQIIDHIYMVDNPRIAEMEKLLENIFRSVNIALVNELAMLAERIGGLNIWEVIEAASTKPFGYMKFTPGPGVGGHCIPIDPYYLSWLARKYDFETRFITLAANVNEGMPYHVANLVVREIAQQPITVKEAKVLLMGVSFKRNVKDLRHSPAEAVMHRLFENGIEQVDYCDPWAPEYTVSGKTHYAKDLSAETISQYHAVVLITDHDDFDVQFIVDHAQCVIDTRNMTRDIERGLEKVVLLGHSTPKQNLVIEH